VRSIANVALGLLLGIVERVSVEERPDELAADILQTEFEMGVLKNSMVAAEESCGANVEALLVVDVFWIDEARGIASASGGDGGVVGMGESVAEVMRGGADSTRSEALPFSNMRDCVATLEKHFYTEAGSDAREKERICHRVTETQRKTRKRGRKQERRKETRNEKRKEGI